MSPGKHNTKHNVDEAPHVVEKKMRREVANSNERRRMMNINSGFMDLKNSIPEMEGTKLSKATILQQASEYVRRLKRTVELLTAENTSLKLQLGEPMENSDPALEKFLSSQTPASSKPASPVRGDASSGASTASSSSGSSRRGHGHGHGHGLADHSAPPPSKRRRHSDDSIASTSSSGTVSPASARSPSPASTIHVHSAASSPPASSAPLHIGVPIAPMVSTLVDSLSGNIVVRNERPQFDNEFDALDPLRMSTPPDSEGASPVHHHTSPSALFDIELDLMRAPDMMGMGDVSAMALPTIHTDDASL